MTEKGKGKSGSSAARKDDNKKGVSMRREGGAAIESKPMMGVTYSGWGKPLESKVYESIDRECGVAAGGV